MRNLFYPAGKDLHDVGDSEKIVTADTASNKGRLQKKVTNLGHCPNKISLKDVRGGVGGHTPQIECPNLLKCVDTKIELNLVNQP